MSIRTVPAIMAMNTVMASTEHQSGKLPNSNARTLPCSHTSPPPSGTGCQCAAWLSEGSEAIVVTMPSGVVAPGSAGDPKYSVGDA